MGDPMSRVFSLLLLAILIAGAPAWAQTASQPAAAVQPAAAAAPVGATSPAVAPKPVAADPAPQIPQMFILGAILVVYGSVIGAFLLVRSSLHASGTWHLGDALAEEAEVTNDAGVTISKMMPSTSRLIAFFGMIMLLFLYLGFGAFALYFFASGKPIPDVNDVCKFLLGGMALFAPYAVNQVRAAVESLSTPKPSAPPKA